MEDGDPRMDRYLSYHNAPVYALWRPLCPDIASSPAYTGDHGDRGSDHDLLHHTFAPETVGELAENLRSNRKKTH